MSDATLLLAVVALCAVVALLALLATAVLARSVLRHRRALVRLRAQLAAAQRDVAATPGTDPVTGLLSGPAFATAVAAASRAAERGGAPVAVLHLGLDGFRGVNTALGRAGGDTVLAEVAQRLRTATRGADELGRLGGDEFAVLLADPDAAVDVAVRLLAVLAEPHEIGATRVSVGVAIGVAIGVAHRRGPGPDLLRAAESALTEAKAVGGGCVRVWDEAADRRREAGEETLARLREAVRAGAPDTSRGADGADGSGASGGDHLEVHYQPVVDVDSCVVSGVECLVRWRRDGCLVPPEEFIGLAERHGLVADLGLAVLARAVADAPRLRAAAGRDLVVAVNVSAPQLLDGRLPAAVAAAATALGTNTLVLEMTESVLVAEDAVTQQCLDALVAAGGHLTVDDFGTGYATLAYLRRRPFSAFKVDRSYVRDLETDPRTRALVEGLVLLAATMGLGLVAEGVETAGQAELLQRMGAPTHQGYLHARPAPLAETLATIGRLRARLGAPVPGLAPGAAAGPG